MLQNNSLRVGHTEGLTEKWGTTNLFFSSLLNANVHSFHLMQMFTGHCAWGKL